MRGPAVFLVAALLLSVSPGPWRVTNPSLAATTTGAPAVAPDRAETVVRRFIEDRGAVYAGDCAGTRSPEDVGKICSTLAAERDDLRAYMIGRTFSEYTTWVFVGQTDAGWLLVGSAPLDFFAPPDAIPWPDGTLTP